MKGYVDLLTGRYAIGWCYDEKNPQGNVDIEVYKGGKLLVKTCANKYRKDVARLSGSVSNGFYVTFPEVPNLAEIRVCAKVAKDATLHELPVLHLGTRACAAMPFGDEAVFFPPEFDYDFYCVSSGLIPGERAYEELLQRYYLIDKAKGKPAAPLARPDYFRKYFQELDVPGLKLEVGPGYRATLKGENVRYFDVLDADVCLQKAQSLNLPEDDVPKVIHYHSPAADMSIINEKFDLIFSSHNIEHQLDIIRHFELIDRLLNTGGIFACIVPDKRFTFDHFKRESEVVDVIAQFEGGPTLKHPLKSMLINELYSTHNSALRHWRNDHGVCKADTSRLRKLSEEYKRADHYIDMHRWYFTPDSFRTLFYDLHDLDYVRLKPLRVYDSLYNQLEFSVIFYKN